ncbi:hypothetical protein EIMP300_85360 [Escherichia coli]|uniref:ATP-binding protein n=1 Tax=Escherichia coli TaxID=562 RepID=A0A8S0G320_ECOLX|nr:hypothetical protein EIMP300_85360 [Escherichia coli]
MMNHLYEQLTALKLTGFRDALKKQLAQPGTYQELGFEERLSDAIPLFSELLFAALNTRSTIIALKR